MMWPRSLLVGRDAASQQSDIAKAESMTQIARSVRVGRESATRLPVLRETSFRTIVEYALDDVESTVLRASGVGDGASG